MSESRECSNSFGDQGQPDWSAWHDDYDRPGSSRAIRLKLVQEQLRRALDDAAPGPVRVEVAPQI